MTNIPILIKTFERRGVLKKCVAAFNKYCPNNPIYIADDSSKEVDKNFFKNFSNVTYYKLPYDVGISAGRNYLLNLVKSKYFLVTDDDLILTEPIDFEYCINKMEENKLSLLGLQIESNVPHSFEIKNNILYRKKLKISGELTNCTFTQNVFIANTQDIQKMNGWDPNLKIKEHMDFFIRFKNENFKCAHLSKFLFTHDHSHNNNVYNEKRYKRVAKYRDIFFKKYNLIKDITINKKK